MARMSLIKFLPALAQHNVVANKITMAFILATSTTRDRGASFFQMHAIPTSDSRAHALRMLRPHGGGGDLLNTCLQAPRKPSEHSLYTDINYFPS